MDMNTTTQVAGLYRAIKEVADATTPDLTLRQLLVLLRVGASTSPLSQNELVDSEDQYKSTVSKIVTFLGGKYMGQARKGGMGLLDVNLDPNDLRARLVSLSKEGERLAVRAVKHLKA